MTGIVARWAGRHRHGGAVVCDECGELAALGTPCPGCRQLPPGSTVGMLAAVIDTPAGPRLVVAERTPAGRWAPTRAVDATGEAVRMVRRQDATRAGGLL